MLNRRTGTVVVLLASLALATSPSPHAQQGAAPRDLPPSATNEFYYSDELEHDDLYENCPYELIGAECSNSYMENDAFSNAPSETLKSYTAGWMGRLSDSVTLNHISIPGTHDSAAEAPETVGVATQTWSILEQLQGGIRDFDLRVREMNTDSAWPSRHWALYHGDYDLELSFNNFLDDVETFLREQANSRETIIVRIDVASKGVNPHYGGVWKDYVSHYPKLLKHTQGAPIPTLGQLRGKIYSWDAGAYTRTDNGSDAEDMHMVSNPAYQVFQTLVLGAENCYGAKCISAGLSAAYEGDGAHFASTDGMQSAVTDYLEKAIRNQNGTDWIRNSTSGAYGVTPAYNAAFANQTAFEYLNSVPSKTSVGTIAMDYPGEGLIYRIIKTNFAFTKYEELSLQIDCYVPGQIGFESFNDITVKFYSGTELLGEDTETPLCSGIGDTFIEMLRDKVVWATGQVLTHIEVSTGGSDAFAMDELHLNRVQRGQLAGSETWGSDIGRLDESLYIDGSNAEIMRSERLFASPQTSNSAGYNLFPRPPGSTRAHWGVDGGMVWCLSKDPEDDFGGFAPHCYPALRFEVRRMDAAYLVTSVTPLMAKIANYRTLGTAPYLQNYSTSIVPDLIAPTAAPTQWPAKNAADWNNSDVTVTWHWEDEAGLGSGIDNANCTVSSVSSGEGAAITLNATCKDVAGNEGSASYVASVDKTAPTVSCGTADGQWHASDVSIPCSAGDGVSGLADGADAGFSLSTSVPAGTDNANAATNSRVVLDLAGNGSTAGPVGGNKVDKKVPAIAIVRPAATQYVHSATLTLSYSVTDSGSGVAMVAPTMDGSPTVAGNGLSSGQVLNLLTSLPLGPHTFTVNAVDRVGNASPPESVTFTIIATAQSIVDDVTQFAASGAIAPTTVASLLAKLSNARDKRSQGQCGSAGNIYGAFINEVQAQTGKSVTPAAAGILIADAQYLIAHCP